jgi:pyruvate-ferredoxin/flavodoxin oxidoreductase
MEDSLRQADLAVRSGYWPLYRFDPRRAEKNQPPLQLDSKPPSIPLKDYIYKENRYRVLLKSDPDASESFLNQSQEMVNKRWKRYEAMAHSDGTAREAEMPIRPKGPSPTPGRPETPGLGTPAVAKPAGVMPPAVKAVGVKPAGAMPPAVKPAGVKPGGPPPRNGA